MSEIRTPDVESLLTPAEVATMFRVDPKTVTRWAKKGMLTSVKTLGGHRRYREAEVRALLNGERVVIALLAPHVGAHAVSHAAPIAAASLIFRRILRLPWRKPPTPWTLSADMSTGEFAVLDEKFEALYRPVNGRYLGTQPRRQPVHGEAPVARVLQAERDAAREAGERARVRYQPARPELLKQVLTGLKKL